MLIVSIILIFSESMVTLFALRWLFRIHHATYYHPINMLILKSTQSIHQWLSQWFPTNSKVDGPCLFMIGSLCFLQSALKLLVSGYFVFGLTFLLRVTFLEIFNTFLGIYLLCGAVVIFSNLRPTPIPLAQFAFHLIAGQLEWVRFLSKKYDRAISNDKLCIIWFVLLLMLKLSVRGLMPV